MDNINIPDINAVPPDDNGYLAYLEDSFCKIMNIYEIRASELELIAEQMSCFGAVYDSEESFMYFDGKVKEVEDALEEFNKALLEKTEMNTVHLSFFSGYARVFCEIEGRIYDATLDLYAQKPSEPQLNPAWNFEDFYTDEGRKSISLAYPDENVYFVKPASLLVNQFSVMEYSLAKLQVNFDAANPWVEEFRKAEGDGQLAERNDLEVLSHVNSDTGKGFALVSNDWLFNKGEQLGLTYEGDPNLN